MTCYRIYEGAGDMTFAVSYWETDDDLLMV